MATTAKATKQKNQVSKKAKGSRARSNTMVPDEVLGEVRLARGKALTMAIASAPIPRAAKYAALRESARDVPACEAKILAGYSPKTASTCIERAKPYRDYQAYIKSERAALGQSDGLTLRDSAYFYHDISQTTKIGDPLTAIKARERLDAILSHNAPKEINQEVSVVDNGIPELMQMIRAAGLTPAQLRAQLAKPTQLVSVDDSQ
jgi:hypothetical protein